MVSQIIWFICGLYGKLLLIQEGHSNNNSNNNNKSRINWYQQGCTSKNNQAKFYKELNSGGRNYKITEIPDKKETQEFQGNIQGKRKEHQKDAEWIKNFKRDFKYKEEQEEVESTPEKIKKILRKMPNCKAPSPDCVQDFWLKSVKSIQECRESSDIGI